MLLVLAGMLHFTLAVIDPDLCDLNNDNDVLNSLIMDDFTRDQLEAFLTWIEYWQYENIKDVTYESATNLCLEMLMKIKWEDGPWIDPDKPVCGKVSPTLNKHISYPLPSRGFLRGKKIIMSPKEIERNIYSTLMVQLLYDCQLNLQLNKQTLVKGYLSLLIDDPDTASNCIDLMTEKEMIPNSRFSRFSSNELHKLVYRFVWEASDFTASWEASWGTKEGYQRRVTLVSNLKTKCYPDLHHEVVQDQDEDSLDPGQNSNKKKQTRKKKKKKADGPTNIDSQIFDVGKIQEDFHNELNQIIENEDDSECVSDDLGRTRIKKKTKAVEPNTGSQTHVVKKIQEDMGNELDQSIENEDDSESVSDLREEGTEILDPVTVQIETLKREIADLHQKNDKLENDMARLRREIEKLESDNSELREVVKFDVESASSVKGPGRVYKKAAVTDEQALLLMNIPMTNYIKRKLNGKLSGSVQCDIEKLKPKLTKHEMSALVTIQWIRNQANHKMPMWLDRERETKAREYLGWAKQALRDLNLHCIDTVLYRNHENSPTINFRM